MKLKAKVYDDYEITEVYKIIKFMKNFPELISVRFIIPDNLFEIEFSSYVPSVVKYLEEHELVDTITIEGVWY